MVKDNKSKVISYNKLFYYYANQMNKEDLNDSKFAVALKKIQFSNKLKNTVLNTVCK